MRLIPPPSTLVLLTLFGIALLAADQRLSETSENQPDDASPPTVAVLTPDADSDGGQSDATRPERPPDFYAAITDRPLFSQTRRPLSQDAATPLPAEEPAVIVEPQHPAQVVPEIALHGVILDGSSRSALLAVEGRAAVWFAEGASIEDWTLTTISGDAIILEADGASVSFSLHTYD